MQKISVRYEKVPVFLKNFRNGKCKLNKFGMDIGQDLIKALNMVFITRALSLL
jgi:hypothetical protein